MQIICNGLISGLAIALLAIGFQTVYLPTRVFFIGLAGIYAVAPFIVYSVLQSGGNWLVACSAALLTSVVLSILCEWANHAPLTRRGASESAHFISSLGIYVVIVQLIILIWGNQTRTLSASLDTAFRFDSFYITRGQLVTLAVAIALLASFAVFLLLSHLGLRLRALADNPVLFALFGNNVGVYRLLAFAFAGVFAAASSILTAYDGGFDPYRGMYAILLAVVAAIIGGRGSFSGPVIGGLLLGLLRAR